LPRPAMFLRTATIESAGRESGSTDPTVADDAEV
jgi:hypothetical protein